MKQITLAILWKLEALNALPFAYFESLAYSGEGADLIVNFQEDDSSNDERSQLVKLNIVFSTISNTVTLISQFPTVIVGRLIPTSQNYQLNKHRNHTNMWSH